MTKYPWYALYTMTMRVHGEDMRQIVGLATKTKQATSEERHIALTQLLYLMKEGHDDHPMLEHMKDYGAVASAPQVPDHLTADSSDEEFAAAGITITREARRRLEEEDA
jgi:hypothetical protein